MLIPAIRDPEYDKFLKKEGDSYYLFGDEDTEGSVRLRAISGQCFLEIKGALIAGHWDIIMSWP